MKATTCLLQFPAVTSIAALLLFGVAADSVRAANKTWDGGGADDFWQNGVNWNGNTAPAPGDSLFFTLNTRLVNSNDFSGAGFTGITFSSPAGAFTLSGNSISLDGGITNNQTLLTETINLPLVLSGDRNVQVVNNAALTLGGVISGGFGLGKTGGGLLTLGVANTFGGNVTILAGTVSIATDNNLGAAPGSPTPGNLVLNGGALRSTANLTLNANRGIALGPTTGTGAGRIDVNSGTTLTYRGIIANNGGTGGLTKGGPGTLVISRANTYTGATSNRVGALTLDFTQTDSPVNDVISSSSALSVGGETTGVGIVNNIQLTMNGKASVVNTQTFNGTSFDVGHSTIRANSGAGGTANLVLGALSHLPGGAVTFTPPRLNAGSGDINTTSTNINGILGGWATISSGAQVVNGIPVATNWASVDAAGNIFPYTNHVVYTSGTIRSLVTASDNLIFRTSGGPGSSVRVDVDHAPGAGTTTDLNTLTIHPPDPTSTVNRFGINIGSNNVLRLGKFGGIFLANVPSVADQSYELGNGTDPSNNPGANAGQNVGTLTAGGAPNTDGELVFTVDSTSQTANGSIYAEVAITDNGSGKVSVIKTGPGPMKFRGHNSFTGNMYILQGRIQMAGAELPNPDSEGANPDAFGRGDIYVLPGGQAFPSGAGGNTLMPAVTNNWFLAGNGVSDNVGAIRFPNAGIFSNAVMTLIGDTRLGGGVFATGLGGRVYNKITGPFNLDFGATGNSGGGANGAILYNQQNDWTGDTAIVGRTGSGGNTRLILGNNDVIPDGFGKGNLILGNTGNNNNSECRFDLNGFNETVNGLVSFAGNEAIQFIENRAASTTSTLSIGNNDASSTFGGTILDAGGTMAITKIGGGALTLTGNNTYTGTTTVNGGTLAVTGSGLLASPDIRVNSGGTFDVSGVASDFAAANNVSVNGGTIVGSSANLNIPNLALTNAQLTIVADTGDINIVAGALTTGAPTNRINIAQIAGISGYPAQFTLIDYSGSIGGAGNNIGIGEVPSTNTVGYVSNDVANTRIVLVLLDGPKPLTWTGISGRNWDEGTTTNWLAFKGAVNEAPVPFNKADSTFFDDTGLTNNINLVSLLSPGGVTVSNETLNYTFIGPGGLRGLPGILKRGAGTLTLANVGLSDFRGGVAVSGGTVAFATDNAIAGGVNIASGATVQVGTNGPSGTLPAGSIGNEGTLNFNRTAALTVGNSINGNGAIVKNNTNVVTLSGANNNFTGAVNVVQGTLRAGSGTALGTADGATTVSSGGTLDINGQQLNAEPVIVSGAGVNSAGAIINSGAEQINAMGNVVLSNNATFGGSGRWDIRGGAASLTTGGQPYSLIKTGANQVALVGVTTIDAALADIDIQQGTFAVQTTTTQVGDSSKTITVRTNAALSLFGLNANPLNKLISVQSGGTITNESGDSIISGTATLNGNDVIGVAGTSLTMNGAIGGSGTLRKTGGGALILTAANGYSGSITNLAGTLTINGVNSSGGPLTNISGATLAGRGTHAGAVSLGTNATLLPGNANVAGTFSSGPLTLNSSRITFDLATNDFNTVFPVTDLISVNGSLTLIGMTTNTFVAGPVGTVTNGQVITLIQHTGARTGSTNNLRLVSPGGYSFSFVDPSTTPNSIRVVADKVPLNIVWRGGNAANPTAWDLDTTTNWVNAVDNTTPVDYSDFDAVSFGDTANTNLVTLVTNLQPASLTMNNNSQTYTFIGPGRLTGSSGLTLQGNGTLIIANSGTNAFTGPININAGALQVGDGGTNGNLGTGALTNNTALIFNRNGTLTVNNGIAGPGSITNNGSGVVVVGGANTYAGTVMIAQGTLRAATTSALGAGPGTFTYVTNGATLDTGGQTLNTEEVHVAGAGVGDAGAVVNTITDANNGLGNVVLDGHTTFGGTRRWDIRGGAGVLSSQGSPFNITKVGSNEVWLVNLAVDAAISNIVVQAGVLGYQDGTTGLGSPLGALTVAAGGGLGFFNSSLALDKITTLNGSGTNNTLDARSGALNAISSLVTLNGACIFNVLAATGGTLTLNGGLTGPASLTKTGAGVLSLTGVNAYTGNTTVSGGTLALSGPAALPATPTVITVGDGATLDLTALTAGPTLTLVAGQTLQGAGVINGSVVSPVGSTVAPGTSVGLLSVNNDVTLQGTTIMELSPLSNTNDTLRTVTGNITYGGTLIVTNLDGVFFGNEVFKLFDSGGGSYLNNFTSVQLPPLPAGYYWDRNQLTVDGTLRLKGPPVIGSIIASGGNVIVSGSNGTNNATYYVLASTNVALPLSNWTRLQTNQFDGSGNFSFTNTINLPQRYYLILLP